MSEEDAKKPPRKKAAPKAEAPKSERMDDQTAREAVLQRRIDRAVAEEVDKARVRLRAREDEVRALRPFPRKDRLQRLDPFLGFQRVDIARCGIVDLRKIQNSCHLVCPSRC
jgi:hypothetical protein